MSQRFLLATIITLAAAQSPAFAQEDIDIEVPVLILDTGSEDDEDVGDEDLDLANVVQTAAKGVTTIQEAPAIVTVITASEIEERGITRMDDVFDIVPGWMRHDALNNTFPFGLTRGTLQSQLYMHNGISMFDPQINVPNLGRLYPMETVKRIEIITGPGGVLWGANSYMGLINVITKDADDIDGVEADIRYGDGPGDRNLMRGYVMAGLPEFLHDDVSVMLHASFESSQGPQYEMPQMLFSTPLPAPNAQAIYGPLTPSDQPQSTIFQANGKLNLGPVMVAFHAPIVVEQHRALGFPGIVNQPDLPEDRLTDADGNLLCPQVPAYLDDGSRNPEAFSGADMCVDRARIGRDVESSYYDRYVMGEYRTRFADNKAGMTLRGYVSQFTRSWGQLAIFAPTALLEGGLSFRFDFRTYRAGGSYDGDLELPGGVRLLYGGEAFREWHPDQIVDSRQGAGTQGYLIAPYDLSRMALPCPFRPVEGSLDQIEFVDDCPITVAFTTDRTVLGAYINPQWRLDKLTLDGGVRIQAAPEALSTSAYDTQFIFSGSAVYAFAKDWHAKINYAEGFRPPVFNNTHANGEGIQIGGNRNLEVEDSRSVTGEVNARLFKGKRQLREVNFRADYSYTVLENLIQIVQGGYANVGDRGIHEAEFLGKIYLKAGHRIELGYTWVKVATEDRGYLAAIPEHYFNLSGFFQLVPDSLLVSSNIKVIGAMEDPNKMVEHRQIVTDPMTGLSGDVTVQPHELTFDRLPPAAVLNLGLTWLNAFGVDKLRARAFAYNAFNSRHYNPDGFGDYEPRLEFLPNPYPDFRFITSLTYTY